MSDTPRPNGLRMTTPTHNPHGNVAKVRTPLPPRPVLPGNWVDDYLLLRSYVRDLRAFSAAHPQNFEADVELNRLEDFHQNRRYDHIPIPEPYPETTKEDYDRAKFLPGYREQAAWILDVRREGYADGWHPWYQPPEPATGDQAAWKKYERILRASRRYFRKTSSEEPDWLPAAIDKAKVYTACCGYPTKLEAARAGAIQPRGEIKKIINLEYQLKDLMRKKLDLVSDLDENGMPWAPAKFIAEYLDDPEYGPAYAASWLQSWRQTHDVIEFWREIPGCPARVHEIWAALHRSRPDKALAEEYLAEHPFGKASTPTEPPPEPAERIEWKPTPPAERARTLADRKAEQAMLLHVARWTSPTFVQAGRKFIPERFLPRKFGGRAHDRLRAGLAERQDVQAGIQGLEHLAGPWWGFREIDLDHAEEIDQAQA
jgi:hypothetical protein